MKDSEILAQFPPASQNSSREIVKQRMEAMRTNPNDRNAKALEDPGFSVDFDDRSSHMGEWEQSDFSANQ